MKSANDKEILAKLRSNRKNDREEALSTLYKIHYPAIKKFITKNQGTANDAKDIFQDAIIIFYKQTGKEEFQLRSSIQTYLYSVSRNLWLTHLNKRKREVQLQENGEVVSLDGTQMELLYKKEEASILRELISKLGEKCRALLLSYFFERMKMAQIASNLGYSNEQVAKNKKYKCMIKLKNLAQQSMTVKELFFKN